MLDDGDFIEISHYSVPIDLSPEVSGHLSGSQHGCEFQNFSTGISIDPVPFNDKIPSPELSLNGSPKISKNYVLDASISPPYQVTCILRKMHVFHSKRSSKVSIRVYIETA